MPTYLTYDIYTPEPDTVFDLQGGPACDVVIRGEVWNNRTNAVYDPARQDYIWSWRRVFRTLPLRMVVVNWFKSRKGAATPFWVRFPAAAFFTAASASSGASAIRLVNNNALVALTGVRRHVWCAATGHERAYRLSNPVLQMDGTVEVTVTPTLAANLASGAALDLFLFCRYGSDELSFSASGLGPYQECDESFVEKQRDTPE